MIFVPSLKTKAENVCTSEFGKETGKYVGLLFNSGQTFCFTGLPCGVSEKSVWEEDCTRGNTDTKVKIP